MIKISAKDQNLFSNFDQVHTWIDYFFVLIFSSLSHHRKRHAGVIHQTPRVITQQTITSANGEQAVIVTTGGDEDEEVIYIAQP